jgi:hypothetical protein
VLPIRANFVLCCLPNLWLHHEIEKREKEKKLERLLGLMLFHARLYLATSFSFWGPKFCHLVTKKFELF